MSLELFQRDLKEKLFRRIYHLWGEEPYLLRHYLSSLEQALFDGKEGGSDRVIREGKDLSAGEFGEIMDQYPSRFPKKLLILQDPLPNCPALELLRSDPGILNEDTVLVLFSLSVPWDRKTAAAKALGSLINREGLSVPVTALDEKMLSVWVRQQMRRHGREMTSEDAEYFVSVEDRDMGAMLTEICKIASHGQGPVCREELDLLCVKTVRARGYELTDALLAGDGPRTFQVLEKLNALRIPGPLILGTIFSVFGQLYRQSLVPNLPDRETAALLGVLEFAVRKNRALLRQLSPATLQGILDLCSQADIASKSTSQEEDVLLTRLLCGILQYTGKKKR